LVDDPVHGVSGRWRQKGMLGLLRSLYFLC
jgi:hypothetical protein